MLDDLALFILIVETGSLNAAARKAGLPASNLTRRLQKLEQELGYRLVHRSARRLTVSEEGWQYYEQCRPLLQALQQATQQLGDTFNQVAGRITVLAPVNLANGILAPAWINFMTQYPEIQLELQLSNHTQDILDHSAALAIRTGPQPDSSLNQHILGTTQVLLVAASAYLAKHGNPSTPEELEQHELLVAEPLSNWIVHHQTSGQRLQWSPQARFRVNDIALAVTAAEAGLGIVFCPLTLCDAGLKAGRLVEVLADWRVAPRSLYAVWPQRQVPARVRVLIDYLVQFCQGNELLGARL